MNAQTLPTIGFIGTGDIASALITGFCERAANVPYPFVVSPRNAQKSAVLAKKYPDRVTVAASMQEVVDRSDWVVISVLPQVGEEVCRSLRFRPEQKVITMLSDKTVDTVREWIGETAVLLHVIPLTFNAFCDGPVVIYPPDPEAAEIFGHIGRPVEVEEERQCAVLNAITAYVVSMFTLMDGIIHWAEAEGLSKEQAADYTTGFFRAVCEQAVSVDADELHRLAAETTPGGLNYMVKEFVSRQSGSDGFEVWLRAMGPIMERLGFAD